MDFFLFFFFGLFHWICMYSTWEASNCGEFLIYWMARISPERHNPLLWVVLQKLYCGIQIPADFKKGKFIRHHATPNIIHKLQMNYSTNFYNTRRPKITKSLHIHIYTHTHRVIRNDCRGFNNLSYTIHLR